MRRLLVLAGIVSLFALGPLAVIGQESTTEAQPDSTAGDQMRTIPAYVFPYDSDGGLNADLTVTANVSGHCGSESLMATGRPDAWDCLGEDNQVYDPCFENPFAPQGDADAPGEVACMASPFGTEVVLLALDAPLDRDKEAASGNEAESWNLPWGLELAGGERCLLHADIEVVLAGEAVHYDCANGGTILGVVDRSQPLWTVMYLADDEMVTTLADVAVAWS